MNRITIAIDAMGGDRGPEVTVPAALLFLKQRQDVRLILVGNESRLKELLTQHHAMLSDRLVIHPASEEVLMDESPGQALRSKKDSSMRVAINLVKEDTAQACVSAGNTGALMAIARFVLKTLPRIDRPAIVTALPTDDPRKKVHVLDLGANVDSTPDQLMQFAVMGSVLVSEIENIPHPRVALLNIGAEQIKGNELVKQTAERLSATNIINYTGFIEGNDIFKGAADVVVCDGFVGNVLLKTSEGLAKFILSQVKQAFQANIFTKLVGVIAKFLLVKVYKRIHPSYFGGATLVGLQKTVIKSHGGADSQNFSNAIVQAVLEVDKHIPERISERIRILLEPEVSK